MKMTDNKNIQGIAYMILGIFFLTVMDAIAKLLMQEELDPIQLITIRSWILITLMFGYYSFTKQRHKIRPNKPVVQIVRGMFGFLAPYCFFVSLKVLPLADATVIFFSGTLMVTALSWPLLREPIGVHRWSAVILGFGGVIIAINPGGQGQAIGYIYCLIGSLSYALLFISGRWLSKSESVASLVFSFSLGMAIVCTALVGFVWVPISSASLAAIFLFSILALSGHACLTTAFSKAPVGVISPFEYSALIWSVVLGYLIWDDIPSGNVFVGAAIIVLCGLYVVYRETMQSS